MLPPSRATPHFTKTYRRGDGSKSGPIGCGVLPFDLRFYPLGASGWTLAVSAGKLCRAKDLSDTRGVSARFSFGE